MTTPDNVTYLTTSNDFYSPRPAFFSIAEVRQFTSDPLVDEKARWFFNLESETRVGLAILTLPKKSSNTHFTKEDLKVLHGFLDSYCRASTYFITDCSDSSYIKALSEWCHKNDKVIVVSSRYPRTLRTLRNCNPASTVVIMGGLDLIIHPDAILARQLSAINPHSEEAPALTVKAIRPETYKQHHEMPYSNGLSDKTGMNQLINVAGSSFMIGPGQTLNGTCVFEHAFSINR